MSALRQADQIVLGHLMVAEKTRRLLEQERVAFLFNGLGTPPNLAIRQYPAALRAQTAFRPTGYHA